MLVGFMNKKTHIHLKMAVKEQPMFKEKLWYIFRKPGELLLKTTLQIEIKSDSLEEKKKKWGLV